jgi:hypothetical protein
LAVSSRRQSLIVAAEALPRDTVWDLADHADVELPTGMNAVRVFSRAAAERSIAVTWAMRSPWSAALGPEPPGVRLVWLARGRLVDWGADEGPTA